MYQPAHLDSFLRLLISHLETVLTQGEQLIDGPSREMHLDMLQSAIEYGEDRADQEKCRQQRDNELLFILQMSQSREWVDRLGRFDTDVERQSDEFLAATFPVERLEKLINSSQSETILEDGLAGQIDIELMMRATFELLASLEEQYDLMVELYDVRQVANGIAIRPVSKFNNSAKIIPLFMDHNPLPRQNNEQ